MRSTINAPISAAPTTDPMTIPAIAPPDRPLLELEAVGMAEAEADEDDDVDEVGDEVGEVVENVMKAVMVGSTTPAHLFSALEL